MQAPAGYKRETFINELKAAMEFVEQRVINRTEVVEQIFLALLTGEHVLIESRTGVGKTLLADQVFAMFSGMRIFKVQASKEQQPDTYFGGLDIEQLKKGLIIHNTEGSLIESEFGFIDEIFDANDYTLRALLTTLNERALVRGVQWKPAAIHTVIAATNYLRISEITEALLDRFLFKSLVIPDKDPFVQYQIGEGYLKASGKVIEPQKKVPFASLKYATSVIKGEVPGEEITVSSEHLYFMNLVVRHYEVQRNRMLQERPHEERIRQKDYYISPRTQAKALDLLRALAFLKNRTAVDLSDIQRLYYLLCTSGIAAEKVLYQKSYDTLHHLYSASGGFDQLAQLLAIESLLRKMKTDPKQLTEPIEALESITTKRSLGEWVKEKFGSADKDAAQKRRQFEAALGAIQPLTEDLKQLKLHLEKEIRTIFGSHDGDLTA
ncbi:MAG TPA: AAA family ATPase [Candidatus Kapabacteria bacterium]|nr:AAA family ATPase [Candidatus Kapabacteria bacterium]HYM33950.1 AAA family ATPase [Steroidobacteraceae bacterium]